MDDGPVPFGDDVLIFGPNHTIAVWDGQVVSLSLPMPSAPDDDVRPDIIVGGDS